MKEEVDGDGGFLLLNKRVNSKTLTHKTHALFKSPRYSPPHPLVFALYSVLSVLHENQNGKTRRQRALPGAAAVTKRKIDVSLLSPPRSASLARANALLLIARARAPEESEPPRRGEERARGRQEERKTFFERERKKKQTQLNLFFSREPFSALFLPFLFSFFSFLTHSGSTSNSISRPCAAPPPPYQFPSASRGSGGLSQNEPERVGKKGESERWKLNEFFF